MVRTKQTKRKGAPTDAPLPVAPKVIGFTGEPNPFETTLQLTRAQKSKLNMLNSTHRFHMFIGTNKSNNAFKKKEPQMYRLERFYCGTGGMSFHVQTRDRLQAYHPQRRTVSWL